MAKRTVVTVIVGLFLMAGPAWALSDADNGGQWVQAPTRQKIQVADILSRDLGGDPANAPGSRR